MDIWQTPLPLHVHMVCECPHTALYLPFCLFSLSAGVLCMAPALDRMLLVRGILLRKMDCFYSIFSAFLVYVICTKVDKSRPSQKFRWLFYYPYTISRQTISQMIAAMPAAEGSAQWAGSLKKFHFHFKPNFSVNIICLL